MALPIEYHKMRQTRGTTAQWAADDDILESGQIGLEIDGADDFLGMKIGNGTEPWSGLPYITNQLLATTDSPSFETITLGTPLAVTSGGTGVASIEDFISGLGLGTMSVQNADAVAITGGTLAGIDTFALNLAYVPTGTEPVGTRYWDEVNKTASVVLEDGVIGQEFEETFITVENNTGSPILNGQVVTYAGTIGITGNILVDLTVAAAHEHPMLTIGIATATIPVGAKGKITILGKIRGIQTNGANYGEVWIDGDVLYKSSTIIGGLTNVPPEAPIPAIPIAVVIDADPTFGTLLARPQITQSLEGLSDVNGTPLTADGQFPVWDNTNKYFDFTANINDYIKGPSISTQYRAVFVDSANTVTESTTILTNADGDLLINIAASVGTEVLTVGGDAYASGSIQANTNIIASNIGIFTNGLYVTNSNVFLKQAASNTLWVDATGGALIATAAKIGTEVLTVGGSAHFSDPITVDGTIAIQDGGVSSNVFVGWSGSGGAITTGSRNVVIGGGLSALTTGADNIIIGNSSGASLAVGASSNIIMGYYAARATAGGVVAIGDYAGELAPGGAWTAIGSAAGKFATGSNWFAMGGAAGQYGGDQFAAFGRQAAQLATGGAFTAFGDYCMRDVADGSYNTAIGKDAALGLTSSTASVFIGYATTGVHAASNQIVIGNLAVGNGSNTATWGNTSITDHYFTGNAHVSGGLYANILVMPAQSAPATPAAGYGLTYVADGHLHFISDTGEDLRISGAASFKSAPLRSGAAGEYYTHGFYKYDVASTALTQAAATQVYGSVNHPYAAHAFIVVSGAGAAGGGTGAVTIKVTGTSTNDNGTTVTADSETIVADITTMTTSEYFESVKKWVGQITFTLDPGATGHTTYSATFNYGLCKYDDFGNRDFKITDYEIIGTAAANDTGFDVEVIHHKATGWTYSAAAFKPTPGILARLTTDLPTESDLTNGERFSWKRANLSTSVASASAEGIIIRVTTGTNNSILNAASHVGVLYT